MAALTNEGDIIDTVLQVDLQLDPTDGDYADWLVRGEEFLQRTVDEFCNAAEDWPFMAGRQSRTMPAATGTTINDGRVGLTNDAIAIGPLGRVMRPGSRHPVEYKNPRELFELRDRDSTFGAELRYYTIDSEGSSPDMYLYGYPFLSQANDLNIYYRRAIPRVDYAGSGGGFLRIPTHFYRTPLALGLREWFGRDGADARALSDFSPAWQRALAKAMSAHRGGPESLRRAGSEGYVRFGMH